MWQRHDQGAAGEEAPARAHVDRGRARRRVHLGHVRAHRHPRQRLRQPLRRDDEGDRRRRARTKRDARRPTTRRMQSREPGAREPRAGRRGCPGREGRARRRAGLRHRSSARTATPSRTAAAADVRVRVAAAAVRPVEPRHPGPQAAGPTQIVLDENTADDVGVHARRPRYRSCSSERHAREVRARRRLPLRRQRQRRRVHASRASRPPTAHRVSAATASGTGSTSAAKPGVSEDQLARERPPARSPTTAAPTPTRSSRARSSPTSSANNVEGPARLPQHVPARLRDHRPVRRLVHHLQHVLDHRRPAVAGARLAPRAGRVGQAGHAFGRRRSLRRRAAVVGARTRARRARRHRAPGPARRVRLRPPEPGAGDPAAHDHRRVRSRVPSSRSCRRRRRRAAPARVPPVAAMRDTAAIATSGAAPLPDRWAARGHRHRPPRARASSATWARDRSPAARRARRLRRIPRLHRRGDAQPARGAARLARSSAGSPHGSGACRACWRARTRCATRAAPRPRASALMIGLALVTLVAIIGASAKQSFTNIIDDTVRAEWLIQGKGFFNRGFTPAIAQSLQQELPDAKVVQFRSGEFDRRRRAATTSRGEPRRRGRDRHQAASRRRPRRVRRRRRPRVQGRREGQRLEDR